MQSADTRTEAERRYDAIKSGEIYTMPALAIEVRPYIGDDPLEPDTFGQLRWVDYVCGDAEVTVFVDHGAHDHPAAFLFGHDGVPWSEVVAILPALNLLAADPALAAHVAEWEAAHAAAQPDSDAAIEQIEDVGERLVALGTRAGLSLDEMEDMLTREQARRRAIETAERKGFAPTEAYIAGFLSAERDLRAERAA